MEIVQVKVKVDLNGVMPIQGHPDDAGWDLFLPTGFDPHINFDHGTYNRHRICQYYVDTRVHFVIPKGYVGHLKPRSSLTKRGFDIPVGTIDAGYTGTIKFFIRAPNPYDIGKHPFQKNERLCQIVVSPLPKVELVEVDDLGKTERGSGSFGSTGRK